MYSVFFTITPILLSSDPSPAHLIKMAAQLLCPTSREGPSHGPPLPTSKYEIWTPHGISRLQIRTTTMKRGQLSWIQSINNGDFVPAYLTYKNPEMTENNSWHALKDTKNNWLIWRFFGRISCYVISVAVV